MLIKNFVLNAFQSNCYVVASTETPSALIVDPNGLDMSPVFDFIAERQLQVEAILCTHGHIDHVLGNEAARTRYDKPLYLHAADLELLEHAPSLAAHYFGETISCLPPDELLTDGQQLTFNDLKVKVIHTPGHSKGSVCFLIGDHLLSGDTLFRRSIGRTDLPGGNYQELLQSIRNQLWPLPDSTIVYPGHMEETTIGAEKKYNPFLSE